MSHLKAILPYARPYRAGIAFGLLLVVLANLFTVVGPYLMKLAIDALDDPDVTHRTVLGWAGLIVTAAVVGGAARFGMRQVLNGISRRIECDLRNDFFLHLLSLDAAFFSETRTGDLMSRATNDTVAVRMAVGPAVMYSVNTAVSFTGALALMVWISPRLTLFALIPMVLLPPVVLRFGRAIHRRFEKIQEQFSTLSTMVQENLTGVRIVRAYGQERAQARDFDALSAEYMERNMNLVRAAGLFRPVLTLFTGAAMVVVLWLGGREVIANRISIGDFVAFGFYLNFLTWPMIALGWVVNLYQRGAASMARLSRILDTEPTIRAPRPPLRGTVPRGEIEFQGVSFRYPGTQREVLRNVSFRADVGETVAIVGPTGSGKTTLVSLIPRLYDPSAGEILLDGQPLRQLDPHELRSIIGVVPQDPFLFSESIEANIGLGIPGNAPENGGSGEFGVAARVIRAARVAQLHDSIEAFPGGYRTRLGERGINLSGGQKQRATLARAIARDPTVMILDDALSAVDTDTEARILSDLRGVMRGRTSFIISHRVSAVMHADKILVLDDGRLVESGTHAQLVASAGTYAGLLRRQLLEEDLESDLVAAFDPH
jgi:ATP-binding cassette subfamily B protein